MAPPSQKITKISKNPVTGDHIQAFSPVSRFQGLDADLPVYLAIRLIGWKELRLGEVPDGHVTVVDSAWDGAVQVGQERGAGKTRGGDDFHRRFILINYKGKYFATARGNWLF